MVKTSKEQLGMAYTRALFELMELDPITPRILGAMWREHFGLHHCSHEHRTGLFTKETEFYIEFPNDADYTAFMLRFG